MVKIKKIALLSVFLIFQLASLYSREDPSADIPILECMENSDGWPIFLIGYKQNLIEIRFPTTPFIVDDGDKLTYTAVDTSVIPTAVYGLTFNKNPSFSEDPHEIFNKIIRQRSQSPSLLISEKVSLDVDCYILDIVSKTKDLKVFRKDRIIVTSQNVYSLYTIFFPHSSENHAYFIKSFNPEF